jgi:hypothetical protein
LAGVVSGRRACPPTVRAAKVIVSFGLGKFSWSTTAASVAERISLAGLRDFVSGDIGSGRHQGARIFGEGARVVFICLIVCAASNALMASINSL